VQIEGHYIFYDSNAKSTPELFFRVRPKLYATYDFLRDYYPTQLLRYYSRMALFQ
jgi:hypothetical protein